MASQQEYNFDECTGPSCKLCADYGVPLEGSAIEETDGKKENIVYLITSEEGKKYFGMTTTNFNHRMAQHRHSIKSGKGDGQKFINYYQKHDFEKAKKEILYTGTDKEDLLEKEKMLIVKYDSINKGLNTIR